MRMKQELSAPPAGEVYWTFCHKVTRSKCIVLAQTWFVARAKACVELGAAPEEIEHVK
jgi:hypothetical protein